MSQSSPGPVTVPPNFATLALGCGFYQFGYRLLLEQPGAVPLSNMQRTRSEPLSTLERNESDQLPALAD